MLAHPGHHQARQANGGKQFQVEVGLPGFVGDRLELARRGSAGVVDQNVEPPEGLDGLGHQAFAVGGLADVGGHSVHLAARGADFGRHLVEQFCTARGDHHTGTFLGQHGCDRFADALRPARDQRHPTIQLQVHLSPRLFCSGR